MRYFSYDEPADNGDNIVVTMSEDDIRKEYYPWWYEKMCKKYGKEYVDESYSFQDCIADWITVNWAWEVYE